MESWVQVKMMMWRLLKALKCLFQLNQAQRVNCSLPLMTLMNIPLKFTKGIREREEEREGWGERENKKRGERGEKRREGEKER
jgi:hypothetical protein